MKKAFEQNVSRAKPRLRLGAFTEVVEPSAEDAAAEAAAAAAAAAAEAPASRAFAAEPSQPLDLSAEVRARIERARSPRPSASEAVEAALRQPLPEAQVFSEPLPTPRAPGPTTARAAAEPEPAAQPQARYAEPAQARSDVPPEVEVQTPPSPREELDSEARRERLKERLKAVRENPRPEPLPATVAETGTRAVERIAGLQSELSRVKMLNLTLTQDLEAARRQAEKATEEARLRMDEARRLTTEMEGRVRLLADLELAALEGERDEALLSLQEVRQALHASADEKAELESQVEQGKRALADSLSEEERLAAELEQAKDESSSLHNAVEALRSERDVLAKQVASLTAERTELLEARKALEAVHRALSHAVAR
jgi:hypothetical protein